MILGTKISVLSVLVATGLFSLEGAKKHIHVLITTHTYIFTYTHTHTCAHMHAYTSIPSFHIHSPGLLICLPLFLICTSLIPVRTLAPNNDTFSHTFAPACNIANLLHPSTTINKPTKSLGLLAVPLGPATLPNTEGK